MKKQRREAVRVDLSEVRVSQRSFGLRVGDDDANSGEDLEEEEEERRSVAVVTASH